MKTKILICVYSTATLLGSSALAEPIEKVGLTDKQCIVAASVADDISDFEPIKKMRSDSVDLADLARISEQIMVNHMAKVSKNLDSIEKSKAKLSSSDKAARFSKWFPESERQSASTVELKLLKQAFPDFDEVLRSGKPSDRTRLAERLSSHFEQRFRTLKCDTRRTF